MDMKEKFKKIGKISYVVMTTILSILFIIICIIGGVQSANKQPSKQLREDSINEVFDIGGINKKYIGFNDLGHSVDYSENDFSVDYIVSLFKYLSSEYEHPHVLNVSNTSYFNYDSSENYSIDSVYTTGGLDETWANIYFGAYDYLQVVYTVNTETSQVRVHIVSEGGNITPTTFNIHVVSDIFYSIAYQSYLESIHIYDDGGIFENLTNGVVAFIGSLNSGIQSMTSIFYNNGLTTIGLLSVIVVSISLAYFLFRLIIGLIRMRG